VLARFKIMNSLKEQFEDTKEVIRKKKIVNRRQTDNTIS
jgi:hypothetical protein